MLIEPFKFTNDYDGFYLLLSKLDSLNEYSSIIGLESTAHYGDILVRLFARNDLNYIEFKELGRFHQKTVKQLTRFKNTTDFLCESGFP